MSTETAPIDRADLWCNCQSDTPNGGPWHPLGDTSFCPPPETPAQFCRWLVTLDDPANAQGQRDRQSVNLTQIIRRAQAALATAPADDAEDDCPVGYIPHPRGSDPDGCVECRDHVAATSA